MGLRSRRKGHSFEREIARLFKPLFPKAQRKLEYQEGDCTGVDLKNTGPFKIQCKRYKEYAPLNKIFEVDEEGIALLITKADSKPTLVALKLEDFLKILHDIGEAYE